MLIKTIEEEGRFQMTFENIITLIFIVGFGYMMFRGGGCCGSHGGHKEHHKDGEGKDSTLETGSSETRK